MPETTSRYQLVWPVELFVWEAQRVLSLDDGLLVDAVDHLLTEAFLDATALSDWRSAVEEATSVWGPQDVVLAKKRAWLKGLLSDGKRLAPYIAPTYFAERHGHTGGQSEPHVNLAMAFATLLTDLQDHGYFPQALPKDCVDEAVDWGWVSEQARHAIHLPFEWDGSRDASRDWDEPTLYSLMEYFHDAAQRPRSPGHVHHFAGCGPHYAEHNSESGALVYRWRANALLDRYGVGMRLGKTGAERGRVVVRFGGDIDRRADERASRGADDPADEVALAVRTFRQRGASSAQKRSALTLLAGELEHRRQRLKVVLKEDEDALFKIANRFGIRHKRSGQQTDYGEEFLDYIFAIYLDSVMLMERLERRAGPVEAV